MTRHLPRITFKIDSLISDRTGLDRAALETALRAEIAAMLAAQGATPLGHDSYRPQVRAEMPKSVAPLAARVAAAAVKAVKS